MSSCSNRFRKYTALVAILVGVAILGVPSQARATFSLRISDGTHTAIVTDGGAGDTDGTTGSIVVATSYLTAQGITGFSAINVTAAFSNATSGDNFAMLELATSARANSTGPLNSLTIDVSQTGFAMPTSAPQFIMTSQALTTIVPGTSTQTVQGFYDSSNGGNNLFSIPGEAATAKQTVTKDGVTPDNPDLVYIVPGDAPFALDYQSVINPTTNGQFFSTDDQLTVTTPAPTGILLFASGLPLCVIGFLRKRRMTTVA